MVCYGDKQHIINVLEAGRAHCPDDAQLAPHSNHPDAIVIPNPPPVGDHGLLPLRLCQPPFYNETRDKQGQALVKAVDQIDLVATVDEVDKKFAGLRQREIEALKGRQAANRTLEIAQVASPGPGGNGTVATRYVSLIDARLERLTGAQWNGRGRALHAQIERRSVPEAESRSTLPSRCA
jgi:hypothetical protein